MTDYCWQIHLPTELIVPEIRACRCHVMFYHNLTQHHKDPHLRTLDEQSSSSLGVRRTTNNFSPYKQNDMQCYTSLQTLKDFLERRMKRKMDIRLEILMLEVFVGEVR
jgi:hypothetical protein